MISTFCYIYVAYTLHVWGFAILNIFFLLLSMYGLWNWKYGNKTSVELAITTTNIQNMVLIIVLGILLTVIFYYILAKTGSASPTLDAFIFAFSMIAQGLLANKKIENWIFWIVINAITVYMFYSLATWISAGLYAILFVLAIRGYREWNIKMAHA
jgi:nicotinamide mononucleotide transporter